MFQVIKLIVLATILVGAGGYVVMNNVEPSKPSPVAKEVPVTKPQENPVVPTKQATPVQAEPVVEPTPQPVQEVHYTFASEMSQAGIAEADYGYVTEMLLDDNGWRTDPSTKLWQRSLSLHGTLTENLAFANRWVLQYHGTWQQAHNSYVNAGNF